MNEGPCFRSVTLDIRYTGRRFDAMSIPLNMLGDLSIINDLVQELASEIYRKRNHSSRVPKNFRENHQLNLCSITKGSTVLGISMSERQSQRRLVPTEQDTCYDMAISEMLGYFNNGESDYEPIILPRLKSLGSMLRDDEGMNFTYREYNAVYNQDVRRRLIGEKIEYSTFETFYGRITEVDLDERSFKLSMASDPETRYDFQMRNVKETDSEVRLEALLQRIVMISGEFIVRKGNLKNTSIDSFQILDDRDVDYRLRELSGLKAGWGENGDEVAPDGGRIQLLIDLYDEFGADLEPPLIFPTPDGNLQFEWDSDRFLELDLNLSDLTGILYCGDEETGINLGSMDGWKGLIEKVGDHAE